jgi:membrane-associated phospholipid phosphatase
MSPKYIKSGIIFCAEYLVLAQVPIFLLLALQSPTLPEQAGVIISCFVLFLSALLVTKILKRIIRKRRPSKKVEYFIPFDRYAFPSAHATALFSISAFIISQNMWSGLISFCISLCIVIARVKSHVHDFLDILAGLVVGVSVTYYLMPPVTTWVYTSLVPALF